MGKKKKKNESGFVFGNVESLLSSWEESSAKVDSLIEYFFDHKTMRALAYNALDYHIADNNEKALVVKEILGDGYTELGTGTNRVAFYHNGVVVKVALDRRGL